VPDPRQRLVGAEAGAGLLAGRRRVSGAALEDAAGLVVSLEQALQAAAKGVIPAARLVQERAPLLAEGLAERFGGDQFVTHRTSPS
jgi:hypothetical protein